MKPVLIGVRLVHERKNTLLMVKRLTGGILYGRNRKDKYSNTKCVFV